MVITVTASKAGTAQCDSVHISTVLLIFSFSSLPPMSIICFVSCRTTHVQPLCGVGSCATGSHCSVCGMYMNIVEEKESPAHIVIEIAIE